MGEGRLLGNLLKNKKTVTLSRDVRKRGRAGVGANRVSGKFSDKVV